MVYPNCALSIITTKLMLLESWQNFITLKGDTCNYHMFVLSKHHFHYTFNCLHNSVSASKRRMLDVMLVRLSLSLSQYLSGIC